MSFPEFYLVFADIFLAMHVALSPYISGVHLALRSIGPMASKRTGSKDTDGSATGAAVEQMFACLLIYEDGKLFLDKDINLKWKEVNEAFAGTFEEDFEHYQVYVNIHKSGLYQIACRYPAFPCADIIHSIVSHIGPETMTLSSVSGTKLATFWAQDYDDIYQMSKLVIIMETPFNLPRGSANSRDILKNCVKELARFKMTPNQIYKMKILWKEYQYMVIFACQLCGQESTKTFPQS